MQLFKIYLAGGMTSLSYKTQNEWRKCLSYPLEQYECDYKIKAINPVDYYNFEDNTTYDSQLEVMNFDLDKLRNSNLVIVNFNDPTSLGTMSELAIAYDRRIPIIGLNEYEHELHPWQKCMCSKIFDNRAELLEYVENYYLD